MSEKTVGAARAALAQQFRDAGLDSPELDARILVGHALAMDHAGLTANAQCVLSAKEIAAIEAAAARRLAREPVDRIVGTREFWSLPFRVTPAVLAPRADTETLVECALRWIDSANLRQSNVRILDIGTGSGAILLALLSELPNATGIGTDISSDALAVARDNAAALGLEGRCSFVECNMADGVSGPFDLMLSNPPYIASGDIAALDHEVREHDPHLALDGGADGLAFYRAIAADAPRLLAPDGRLIVELGIRQDADVRKLFETDGLHVESHNDLAGVPRVLLAKRGKPVK